MIRCPVRGCDEPRHPGDEMCPDHWQQVPAEVREQLMLARRLHGPWSDEADDARERAFAFVDERPVTA